MGGDVGRFDRLMERVIGGVEPAFALLHRPDAVGNRIELLVGDVMETQYLADLPVPEPGVRNRPRHEVLAMVPYRQITERGFQCWDDQAPLLAMQLREVASCTVEEVIQQLPDIPISLSGVGFDLDDEEYAAIVRRVLADEIGQGVGANFVVKRSLSATVEAFSASAALSLFRRLLIDEQGAYWTFLVHTGTHTFVGATPERHVSLFDGTAVMNPISGTYRYPAEGPTLRGVLDFLADRKESAELFMVLDEELKMMARVTEQGGRVVGPFLREMKNLAHTEYLIEGGTARDPRDLLRETMLAPTVTGSPLESACRVISEYEPHGRGHYSGVAALISRDANGGHSLDSAILLRTAEIVGNRLRIAVGATLVRDSDPESEVLETHVKLRGMLRSLGVESPAATAPRVAPSLGDHEAVRGALAARNDGLARFWLNRYGRADGCFVLPHLVGRRALIVDAEDSFTAMLSHQLTALGLEVELRRLDEPFRTDGVDLVVMGPGPGDPRDVNDPRIASLHRAVGGLITGDIPFLAVCLSHQVLGIQLGFPVTRRRRPNQGVQQYIDFFGRPARLGFYNTFALQCESEEMWCEAVDAKVAVSREHSSGQVYGLAGPHFRSVQFHPESVLSPDGLDVLAEMISALLPAPQPSETQTASA